VSPGQYSKKAEPDDGRCLESTCAEIGIGWRDDFVKSGNGLMKLSADATYKKVLKWRHLPQKHDGAILQFAVRLS
jgi:hypothetical protein